MNVGFIGLGIMGAPMAGQLLAAGHKLFVNTRGQVPNEIADGGAKVCTTGVAVATNSDIIIIMVPDTPDVEKVLFGKDGVASGLSKGKIVVDMSSISPIATKDFAARVNAAGADYLERRYPAARWAQKRRPLPSWWAGRRRPLKR